MCWYNHGAVFGAEYGTMCGAGHGVMCGARHGAKGGAGHGAIGVWTVGPEVMTTLCVLWAHMFVVVLFWLCMQHV